MLGCNSFKITPRVALIIPAPIRITSGLVRMALSDMGQIFKVQIYSLKMQKSTQFYNKIKWKSKKTNGKQTV
jgi:hypothetical protein